MQVFNPSKELYHVTFDLSFGELDHWILQEP
jgi:hypothetical protein